MQADLSVDILIVGAGLAGLSAALHCAQLAAKQQQQLSICVLEKAPEIGAHSLSGGILNPHSLTALLPDWQQRLPQPTCRITSDALWWLTRRQHWSCPIPPRLHNQGHYLVSINQICQILAKAAQALGVEVLTGFTGQTLWWQDTKLRGIKTGDMGLNADGSPGPQFTAGVHIEAKQTWLAEGCRGHLTEAIIERFNLRQQAQHYALGVREIWQAPSQPGHVIHTVGWPLPQKAYGGGFIYHYPNDRIAIGWISGLHQGRDPHDDLQHFKTHPSVAPLLKDANRIGYGARTLNEGGWQALPKLNFPGGLILGCAAGMVDLSSMKGMHHAIRSGMLAATSYMQQSDYDQSVRASCIGKALYRGRNLKPALEKGRIIGSLYLAIDQWLLRGNAPWTFKLKPTKSIAKKHAYNMKYDAQISFDKPSSLYLTQVTHRENQPAHLLLQKPLTDTHPVMQLCPAQVYQIDPQSQKFLLNPSNCIHCKACTAEAPNDITWVTPEGGQGPQFKETHA